MRAPKVLRGGVNQFLETKFRRGICNQKLGKVKKFEDIFCARAMALNRREKWIPTHPPVLIGINAGLHFSQVTLVCNIFTP